MISIIIPAYNEENTISSSISSVYRQVVDDSSFEVIVVADGCFDCTIDIIRRLQRRYLNLHLIVEPQRRGKAFAISKAKEFSKGDILILTDADVIWAPFALPYLVQHFRYSSVGAVCGQVLPLNPSNNVPDSMAIIRCAIWDRLRRNHYLNKSIMIPSGNLYAIRRSLFPELPINIIAEDAYVGWAMAKTGHLFVYEPKAVVRTIFPQNLKDYLKQRLRNQVGRIQLNHLSSDEISAICYELLQESLKQVHFSNGTEKYHSMIHLFFDLLCRIISKMRFRVGKTYVPWEQIRSTKVPRTHGHKNDISKISGMPTETLYRRAMNL